MALLSKAGGFTPLPATQLVAGSAGSLGPLVVGLVLTALVYMGGHVSGAHYNPAVSFGLFLRRVVPLSTLVSYWLMQLVAGSLAFAFAHSIGAHTAGIHAKAGMGAWRWDGARWIPNS